MSTPELRAKLIKKIKSTSDKNVLLEATRLLDLQLQETPAPYELSDDMNAAIDEAKEQFAKGEYLSHDEANKEIDEWFGK